jgi:hypothetical protein
MAGAASLVATVASGQERSTAARTSHVAVSTLFSAAVPASAKQNSKSPAVEAPPIVDALFLPNAAPRIVPAAFEVSDELPLPVLPPETSEPPIPEPRPVARPNRILAIRAVPRAAPALLGLDAAMLPLTRQPLPAVR